MRAFFRIYGRNHGAVAGLVVFGTVALLAVLASLLYPQSPWAMVAKPMIRPFTTFAHPLGTDMLGRDVAAGMVHGARVSLMVGLAATSFALAVGVAIGAVAGYLGGLVDDILMAVTEFFQTIPQLVMAVMVVAILGPNLYTVIAAIGVVSWPSVARLVRSEFVTLRQREFVQAAVVIGQRPTRIIFSQILPNAMSSIVVMGSFMIATAILTEAALSFLGLGDRNRMSWGSMIGAARGVIRQSWWLSVGPGLALLLTVLSINMIGEGLNDALSPHLRKRGD
jgi:peptide/nickel transport system permease protein